MIFVKLINNSMRKHKINHERTKKFVYLCDAFLLICINFNLDFLVLHNMYSQALSLNLCIWYNTIPHVVKIIVTPNYYSNTEKNGQDKLPVCAT